MFRGGSYHEVNPVVITLLAFLLFILIIWILVASHIIIKLEDRLFDHGAYRLIVGGFGDFEEPPKLEVA